MEATDVVAQVASHESVLFPLNRLPEKFAVVLFGGGGIASKANNQAGNDR
jgi:hypothetical protein